MLLVSMARPTPSTSQSPATPSRSRYAAGTDCHRDLLFSRALVRAGGAVSSFFKPLSCRNLSFRGGSSKFDQLNEGALRLEPKFCFSATTTVDGSSKVPVMRPGLMLGLPTGWLAAR